MNSRKIQTLAAAAISFLLLIYVGYQVYLSTHRSIRTETAMYGTVADTVQTQGFAVRDETVITDSYRGVLSYLVDDGARVPNGGVIAQVFSNEEDAAAQNQIGGLEREIENLRALTRTGDYFTANSSTINAQIYTAVDALAAQVADHRFSEITALKEELQTVLNRKQLLTGEVDAERYEARIEALEREKAQLERASGAATGAVRAPQAGYFISTVDGLENAVAFDRVKALTPAEAQALLDREENRGGRAYVGKICSDFNWYLVCVVDEDILWKFEDISQVRLDIPFASQTTIPAAIAAINRDPAAGKAAVILECSYMDADIASVRNESIRINVRSYSGVLVNEKALRFRDVTYTEYDADGNPVEKVQKNVKGVYVLTGRQLEFVQIFTEKTVNGYAICKTELSAEERRLLVTDHTVQLYDNVVVEGTELYDGKTVR